MNGSFGICAGSPSLCHAECFPLDESRHLWISKVDNQTEGDECILHNPSSVEQNDENEDVGPTHAHFQLVTY